MSLDDFGYIINKDKGKRFLSLKKPLKIALVLISILVFVFITISAHYFSTSGQDEEIQIVKSPEYKIKVRSKSSGLKPKNIDKTIYDNIVGGKGGDFKTDKIKVINAPKAAKSNASSYRDKTSIVDLANRSNKQNSAQEIKEDIKVISKDIRKANQRPYSRVQLAALKSKEAAYSYWLQLKKTYPRLFLEKKYFIHNADLGRRGVFYRLQIGNFRNQIKAEKFCEQFIARARKKKSDCIIVE